MRASCKHHIIVAVLAVPFFLLTANNAAAQGRSGDRNSGGGASIEFTAEISFSVGDRDRIRAHYSSNHNPGVEALPPGIRRKLARGKAMPPGIAKRSPPAGLRSSLSVPNQFEVFEVGRDVVLVKAATGIIHDVLKDVIR